MRGRGRAQLTATIDKSLARDIFVELIGKCEVSLSLDRTILQFGSCAPAHEINLPTMYAELAIRAAQAFEEAWIRA